MLRFRSLWLGLGLFILAACHSVDALPPTATTLRVIQATPVPTAELHAVASQPPEATSAVTPPQCEATAALPTTQYTVRAAISYEQHSAAVQQHIRTINRSNETLNQIVFDIEPNRFPGVYTPYGVTADLGVLSYELTGRRMTIDLAEPLEPGCTIELDLSFTLQIHPIGRGVSGFGGFLGYSSRQLNLGQWLPTLALRRDGEWITHDVIAIGEQTVTEVADWDVTLTVDDAPDRLVIAAPGILTDHTGKQWHYMLEDARDFTISLSPVYQVLTQVTERGSTVELYTFGGSTVETADGTVDSAVQALTAAAQALALYSDLFGTYPYDRFVVVQGDFPDGMEFSGLVFVSDNWFRSNNGTPQSYLTTITVHETSHQWWYARVGSDQALTPWLDEALATYSEYIFYEEHYPDLKEWWWNFRVNSFLPGDYTGKRVDSTVYEFSNVREYINAVYLRGAHMLDALRTDLGTEVFFDWLRRYAEAGRDRVVTPDVFWSLLTPEQLELTSATRATYLSGG